MFQILCSYGELKLCIFSAVEIIPFINSFIKDTANDCMWHRKRIPLYLWSFEKYLECLCDSARSTRNEPSVRLLIINWKQMFFVWSHLHDEQPEHAWLLSPHDWLISVINGCIVTGGISLQHFQPLFLVCVCDVTSWPHPSLICLQYLNPFTTMRLIKVKMWNLSIKMSVT